MWLAFALGFAAALALVAITLAWFVLRARARGEHIVGAGVGLRDAGDAEAHHG